MLIESPQNYLTTHLTGVLQQTHTQAGLQSPEEHQHLMCTYVTSIRSTGAKNMSQLLMFKGFKDLCCWS